jgi:hypothetical protein
MLRIRGKINRSKIEIPFLDILIRISTNNNICSHDVAEILLKVALNTIKLKTNLTADDNSYHWEGSRGKDVLIGRSQN